MSLRARLTVLLVAVVLTFLLAGFAVARSVRSSLVQQVDRRLEATVPVLGPQLNPGDRPSSGAPRSPLANAVTDVFIGFAAEDGTVTQAFGAADAGAPQVDAELLAAAAAAEASGGPGTRLAPETVGSTDGGGRWRVLVFGPRNGEQPIVAISLDQVDATMERLLVALAVAALVVIAVLAVGGWWIWRLGLKPVRQVADVADAVAHGDLARRAAPGDPRTEAGHLARAFNQMLDERQAAEERLRQFAADASHELRTPVTAIRGFADLYRQGALPDKAAVDDAMRRIGAESVRMGRLVDDMLLLARLDEGRPLERVPVDLSAIVRDAVLDASAMHPDRPVACTVTPGLVVLGDDARLRQVVNNLLTNALVHTPPEAEVSVDAHPSPGACVVEVRDHGPGLDAEAAARVFDRFWRSDASRARHRGGSGLGLAIVRSIVEAHGGRVVLDTAPGQGATFRVVLPATTVPPTASGTPAAALAPASTPSLVVGPLEGGDAVAAPADSPAVDSRDVDSQAVDSQAVDSRDVDSRAVDSQQTRR